MTHNILLFWGETDLKKDKIANDDHHDNLLLKSGQWPKPDWRDESDCREQGLLIGANANEMQAWLTSRTFGKPLFINTNRL